MALSTRFTVVLLYNPCYRYWIMCFQMSNWIINWDCMLVTIFECTWGSLNTSLIWFSSPSSTCHSYLFPGTEVSFCFHQILNVPLTAWPFKFFLHLLIAFVWAQGHKKNPHHSRSESANTMQGFFPPSSSVTLFRLLFAAASLISWPTWAQREQTIESALSQC